MIILKHFLYILLIIACTSVATLYISKITNKSGRIYKTISTFTVSILIYMVIEMFLASSYIPLLSVNARYFIIILSEAAFFSIILAWIRMIAMMSKHDHILEWKRVIIYTITYAVLVELLAMLVRSGSLGMYEDELSLVIMLCDMCFDIVVMVISAIFLRLALKRPREETERIFAIGLSGLLIAYMIYALVRDIRLGAVSKGDFSIYQEFDPILIFYTVVCIVLVKFAKENSDAAFTHAFYKAIGIETGEEEAWENLAERFKFTDREMEVVQLLYHGKSNTDIAELLFISESTVKHHIRSIFQKTDTKNRYELISLIK